MLDKTNCNEGNHQYEPRYSTETIVERQKWDRDDLLCFYDKYNAENIVRMGATKKIKKIYLFDICIHCGNVIGGKA